MRRRLSIGLVAVAAIVAALLAVHGLLVQAQPVATIALPAPGGTVELYPGCNNIALTFPDGTASQTVVEAVTPAGVVRSMWRHNAAQGRWEGYAPAAPAASDLLTVNFLDAVWLCVAGVAAGPTPTTTPTETACTQHVAPGGNDGNPGTAQAPWRTIQHAADTAQPGNTVCVGSGDYSGDGEVFFSRSGTADAPITFAAAPGETVTVNALTLRPGTSYLRLVGFAVQGFPIWGVTLLGDNHHILLSHLDVSSGEVGCNWIPVGGQTGDPLGGSLSLPHAAPYATSSARSCTSAPLYNHWVSATPASNPATLLNPRTVLKRTLLFPIACSVRLLVAGTHGLPWW